MTPHKTILGGFTLLLDAGGCQVSKGDYRAHLGALDADPMLRNPTGDVLPIPRLTLLRVQAWVTSFTD